MIMIFFVLFFGLISCCAADESSVEFANSVSEIDFGQNVAYGSENENEVNSAPEREYLRNFKSLHNETDLQALASDDTTTSAETIASRVDNGPRVLRGTSDISDSLQYPLFTPYKHNKIDTADFSDCALQGEWKPIGIPNDHYRQHAEDHQKEHFHSLAEGPEAHQSIAVPNTHSPLDAEGVAFWNQFVRETGSNLNFMHNEKFPRRPPNRHPPKKHFNKSRPNFSSHQGKQYPFRHRPPPSTSSVHELDTLEGISNHVAENHIDDKPLLADNALLQHTLPAPHLPLNGLDLSLVQGDTLSPLDLQISNHQPTYQNPDQSGHSQLVNHQDESYLSPPPLNQKRFPSKLTHRPVRPPPQHFKGPRRPPPPVVENSDDQHHHSEHIFPHQNPDPSSFTCGHEHKEGTNYHTASFQVEGEVDPALFEEEIHGQNHLAAPIIVGQPILEHGGESSPFESQPKLEATLPVDLEEEGTETGGSNEDISREIPFKDQLPSSSNTPESSTQDVYRKEAKTPFYSSNQFSTGIKSPLSFDMGFDHSGFSEVDISHVNVNPNHQSSSSNGKEDSHQEKTNPSSFSDSFFSSEFENSIRGPQKTSSAFSTSFSDFSFSPPNGSLGKNRFNQKQPRKKRPHKQYEVNEDSGERIPLTTIFPPKKMPKQFDMRMPNLANPNAKRPPPSYGVKPPSAKPPKFKTSVNFDGSTVGVYSTHPRNKVTKIRMKMKNRPARFSNKNFRIRNVP